MDPMSVLRKKSPPLKHFVMGNQGNCDLVKLWLISGLKGLE